MKLKEGDKLLCKRSISNNSKNKRFFFLRNNFYIIENVTIYANYNICNVAIRNERGHITIFRLKYGRSKMLYRHFYTPQEIRKIKLEKLNKI